MRRRAGTGRERKRGLYTENSDRSRKGSSKKEFEIIIRSQISLKTNLKICPFLMTPGVLSFGQARSTVIWYVIIV